MVCYDMSDIMKMYRLVESWDGVRPFPLVWRVFGCNKSNYYLDCNFINKNNLIESGIKRIVT